MSRELPVASEDQILCERSPFLIELVYAHTDCHHRTRGIDELGARDVPCQAPIRWASARWHGVFCTAHAAARARLLQRQFGGAR